MPRSLALSLAACATLLITANAPIGQRRRSSGC